MRKRKHHDSPVVWVAWRIRISAQADDIRIHPTARYGLAKLVNNAKVEIVKRNSSEMRFSEAQQAHVGLEKRIVNGRDNLDRAGLPVSVFYYRYAEQNLTFFQLYLRDGTNGVPQSVTVRLLRAGLLPKTNRAHFKQSRRKLSHGLRVCLGTSQNDDSIGPRREAIDVSHGSVFRRAKFQRLHRRPHRGAHRLLSNTEPVQNLRLAFRRRSTMTAHGRHDERISAAGLHGVRDSGKEFDKSAYSATSGGYGDMAAEFCFVAQSGIE